MTNEERARWGREALAHGSPDQGEPMLKIGSDVIANILHALAADRAMSPSLSSHVVGLALGNFADEIADEQEASRGS